MKVQKQAMKCGDCGQEFEGELLVECSIDLFNHAIREQKCPKCWSHNILLKI